MAWEVDGVSSLSACGHEKKISACYAMSGGCLGEKPFSNTMLHIATTVGVYYPSLPFPYGEGELLCWRTAGGHTSCYCPIPLPHLPHTPATHHHAICSDCCISISHFTCTRRLAMHLSSFSLPLSRASLFSPHLSLSPSISSLWAGAGEHFTF